MQNAKLQIKIQNFQKKYPKFIYQNYSWRISKSNLEIFFDFKIEPNIKFRPKVIIEGVGDRVLNPVRNRRFLNGVNNLVFHLGLIELLSYWKATCSPEIIIQVGLLNPEQIKWWKDLIEKGMGQFFYENKINFHQKNFLKIEITDKLNDRQNYQYLKELDENKVLVPIGGGKDSVVTLKILREAKKEIQCFSLNPTEATKKIMRIAGCKKPIIVEREIDPKLLELNQKGFLNGHTPFSAYLAFLSVLIAVLFNLKYIAFSNERSSNEGNLKYLGEIINHQYSKSFDFEKKFRDYSKKYLAKDIEYFSFLRPLYEVQIAKLFSKYSKYLPVFLSCNIAYQTASGTKKPLKKWCGKCPKCLFVFTSLYPFVKGKKLIKILGKNLFEDQKLIPLMLQLVGERKFKPFECVGTKKESLITLYLSYKKCKIGGERVSAKLPFLLRYFEEEILPKYPNLEEESKKIMNSWNNQNSLPKEFKTLLK